MIKKSVFEDELIAGMQRELSSQNLKEGMDNLVKAADYVNSAIEILEDVGMTAKADKLLAILTKIATDNQDAKKKLNPTDRHTQGLTSDKMVENLKHHGIVFNLADDGKADDMLDLDISDNPLEINEETSTQKTFEDE